MLYLCITPEREHKTGRLMQALQRGWGEPTQIVYGRPPDDGHPFVVWGQHLLGAELIKEAHGSGRPWWLIDNGYWNPAKGRAEGYYRITYRSFSPVSLASPPAMRRTPLPLMMPWRRHGRHIVLALPGPAFGSAIGMDVRSWINEAPAIVRKSTRRPVLVRPKGALNPLGADLRGAWVLVTHSSNVAVDAVIAGVPVFVAPTSPAAPVGNLDLKVIEQPRMPPRSHWLSSLACQHYTLSEMASGFAATCMRAVQKIADGEAP